MIETKLILTYIKCLINNTKKISTDVVMDLEEEYTFLADYYFDSALEFIGITNHWYDPCDDSSDAVYTYYEFDFFETYMDLWDKIDLLKTNIPSNIYDKLIKFNIDNAHKHNQYYAMAFQSCMLDNYYDSDGKAKGVVFWSEVHPIETISVLVFLIAFIDHIKTLTPILKSILRKAKKAF